MADSNPASLFIEEHSDGVAFYINGDLQFDSRDEAIYHEHLVGPAIAVANDRFPGESLHVLICGGGDGLAARDVLRFEQVSELVLVDYDPAVVDLARSKFLAYNQGSLNQAGIVTVHTTEAFEFVQRLPDQRFHVVICDFTCPNSAAAETLYSREWFEQIRRVLLPQGLAATNGLSPDREPQAFWCIYQTIMVAGFDVKPMRLEIPSFARNGYGQWGFFLASVESIRRSHLESLKFPLQFQTLDSTWQGCFIFPNHWANWRDRVYLNTLDHPQLLFYRFNPRHSQPQPNDAGINFLDLQEVATVVESDRDPFALSWLVQQWLHQYPPQSGNCSQLCPVLHEDQTPKMAQSWFDYSPQMLAQIDLQKLSKALIQQPMPDLLKRMIQDIPRSGQKLNPRSQLAIVLSAVMMAANLSVPDTAYAKGFWGWNDGSDRDSSSTLSVLLQAGFVLLLFVAMTFKPFVILIVILLIISGVWQLITSLGGKKL